MCRNVVLNQLNLMEIQGDFCSKSGKSHQNQFLMENLDFDIKSENPLLFIENHCFHQLLCVGGL